MSGKQPKRKTRPGMDEYGRTPLHHAAIEGDVSKAKTLLESGANSNAQDDNGWTPLHFAAQEFFPEVATLLTQHGAAVDAQDARGNSPLFRAVFCSRGRGDLIAILRRAGADPQLKNRSAITPLSLAHQIANYDVRQFFNDLQPPEKA